MAVLGVSILALFAAVQRYVVSEWEIVLLLVGLRVLVEWFSFKLPDLGSASLAFALVFAALLLDGPLAGAVVAVAGAISPDDIRERKSALTMLFNASQFVVTGLAGGVVLLAVGQEPLLQSVAPAGNPAWLAAALLSAVVIAMTNMALVGGAIALIQGVSPLVVWKIGRAHV